MAYTKRQVVTAISVIYLIVLTAVACYAHNSVQRHSLPISSILSAFTIALPAISGLIIERLTRLSHTGLPLTRPHSTTSRSPAATTFTLLLLTIFTTTLVTLSATHLGPSNALTCHLNTRWTALFRGSQATAIRRIQDDFQCCGLHSVYDMAWPFPTHEGGRTQRSRCAESFGRNSACFDAWREQERSVGGTLFVVGVLVYLWDLLIIFTPTARPSFLSRLLGSSSKHSSSSPADDDPTNVDSSARRAIDYHRIENGYGYSDNPNPNPGAVSEVATDEQSDGGVGAVQRAVEERLEGGNSRHTLVPSGLGRDEGEWREGGGLI